MNLVRFLSLVVLSACAISGIQARSCHGHSHRRVRVVMPTVAYYPPMVFPAWSPVFVQRPFFPYVRASFGMPFGFQFHVGL